MPSDPNPSLIDRLIRFCLENKLVVVLATVVLVLWGLMVAPFDWEFEYLPRDPVPVDAIPDIGENQQIVFTEWTGRSPQDIEDQITYPLTTALLGLPEVKTIRSYSMFGFSSIYIIFKEESEFYWTRSRILEKLNSLPTGTLPLGVQPQLGPEPRQHQLHRCCRCRSRSCHQPRARASAPMRNQRSGSRSRQGLVRRRLVRLPRLAQRQRRS